MLGLAGEFIGIVETALRDHCFPFMILNKKSDAKVLVHHCFCRITHTMAIIIMEWLTWNFVR